jgi:hypothetical protein
MPTRISSKLARVAELGGTMAMDSTGCGAALHDAAHRPAVVVLTSAKPSESSARLAAWRWDQSFRS